jgi:DNA-3-methyladenine glycosylase
MKKLPDSFYRRPDTLVIAKELLGKIIVTRFGGVETSGRIVETEAYLGTGDKASHAYGGRNTTRTAVMYKAGGHAYVYLCYGIHHLFNVVTHVEGQPHAVLVRAVEPLQGIGMMLERMKKDKADVSIGRGPGNVSKALGFCRQHTGSSLRQQELFIAADDFHLLPGNIMATPRIGVDYAAEDALLPYRFYIKGNPYVSGKKSLKS